MSPGDQIISVFINSIGVFINAIINLLFSVFLVPFFEEIFASFGFVG